MDQTEAALFAFVDNDTRFVSYSDRYKAPVIVYSTENFEIFFYFDHDCLCMQFFLFLNEGPHVELLEAFDLAPKLYKDFHIEGHISNDNALWNVKSKFWMLMKWLKENG